MTPSEIKPGMKFGHWDVLKYDHTNNHRIKYFLCKCDVCGSIRAVRGSSLIDGTSTACSRQCANTLIGQTIGEWSILKNDKSRVGYYICKCSCGNIKSVSGRSLKYGATKSCGCLKRKNTKKRHEENAWSHVGEVYGYLTILEPILKDESYWYRCRCKCGNETTVLGKRLFRGETYSCGCLDSWANTEMDLLLTKMNIPHKREYRIPDCKDKVPLPFDFAFFNEQDELIGLMELNGSQHYSATGSGWRTPERLIVQQKHDYIKRKFCEDNQIPFLVIPYQFFNELEKFLTTSDFWKIITENFND